MPGAIVGTSVCLLGAYVAWRGAAVLWFAGKWLPGSEPRYLVDKHIYRFVLHAMYWGYTMFWAGLAIWAGSVGLLAEALAVGLVFIAWSLAVEQPRLRRRYKAAYEEYRRQTPIVLPVWKALYYTRSGTGVGRAPGRGSAARSPKRRAHPHALPRIPCRAGGTSL